MSTYLDLITAVRVATTRASSQDTLIRQKINAAMRQINLAGRFYPDHVELVYGAVESVDPDSYTNVLALPDSFRSFSYIDYPPDMEVDADCVPFRELRPEELNVRHIRRQNQIYYISGTNFHLRQAHLTSQFYIGYYKYLPLLSADTDSNWITDLMPELVTDLAASQVFSSLGNTEQANTAASWGQAQLRTLVAEKLHTSQTTVESGR